MAQETSLPAAAQAPRHEFGTAPVAGDLGDLVRELQKAETRVNRAGRAVIDSMESEAGARTVRLLFDLKEHAWEAKVAALSWNDTLDKAEANYYLQSKIQATVLPITNALYAALEHAVEAVAEGMGGGGAHAPTAETPNLISL